MEARVGRICKQNDVRVHNEREGEGMHTKGISLFRDKPNLQYKRSFDYNASFITEWVGESPP